VLVPAVMYHVLVPSSLEFVYIEVTMIQLEIFCVLRIILLVFVSNILPRLATIVCVVAMNQFLYRMYQLL